MLTSILGVLILASSISSLSISDPLANSTDGIDTLRATAMDPRILDPTASTRRSPRLDRRVSIDQSCSEAAVELLTELMVEVEVIARWAVQGAPLRSSSRGGSRGGSRGTAVGGFGRGRGRNPPFADNAFRRYFSRDRTRPQATIPLAIRSYVRARFQLVAEQASRIRRPGHPEFRQDQIFRCEQEGDPRGLCRGDGAPPFIHTMAGRPGWNIICPDFFRLPELPIENEVLIANQWIALIESLLASAWVTRQQGGELIRNDRHGIQANLGRYLEYAHALYYQPHGMRPPVT